MFWSFPATVFSAAAGPGGTDDESNDEARAAAYGDAAVDGDEDLDSNLERDLQYLNEGAESDAGDGGDELGDPENLDGELFGDDDELDDGLATPVSAAPVPVAKTGLPSADDMMKKGPKVVSSNHRSAYMQFMRNCRTTDQNLSRCKTQTSKFEPEYASCEIHNVDSFVSSVDG